MDSEFMMYLWVDREFDRGQRLQQRFQMPRRNLYGNGNQRPFAFGEGQAGWNCIGPDAHGNLQHPAKGRLNKQKTLGPKGARVRMF